MKTILASLEGLPEILVPEYEARDGKFFLKIDGETAAEAKTTLALAESNAKVIEFRNNNILHLKELDDLRPLKIKLSSFDGLDPEEAKSALIRVKSLDKKGIKDADDFDNRVKETVEILVQPLRDQLKAAADETVAERRRADDFLLHSTIGDSFVKSGGKPNAVDFVVGLAKENFEVKESKVTTKSGKFSTEKPGNPLTITEWLTSEVKKSHDYLYETSKGGGADPVKSGTVARAGAKAGQTILMNPSPQELGAASSDIVAGKVRVEYTVN